MSRRLPSWVCLLAVAAAGCGELSGSHEQPTVDLAAIGTDGSVPADLPMAISDSGNPILDLAAPRDHLADLTAVDLPKVADLAKPGDLAVAPSCADQARNQDETDIDCGGKLCPKCNTGKACAVAADCSSNLCAGGGVQ
ncbi:MAG: hypothetical protein EXR72_21990 [Myxococcales bacterium]|nr:hypothetical protein [Myxococcales bacterium]